MKIFDKDYKPIKPVGDNVLLTVSKEEHESVTKSGLITSPSKTVFIRNRVEAFGPDVTIYIGIGDYVELTGPCAPTFFDEEGKCSLAVVPQSAIIAVYSKLAE